MMYRGLGQKRRDRRHHAYIDQIASHLMKPKMDGLATGQARDISIDKRDKRLRCRSEAETVWKLGQVSWQ
jgi:hypothetical protein